MMKNKFIVSAIILTFFLIISGSYWVWNKYFNPFAKQARESQKNYQQYLKWEKEYKKLMAEDKYGGKTPEETLKMFIEALKKEDFELASKYIYQGTGASDYNNREKYKEALSKIKNENRLQEIIETLEKAREDQNAAISDRHAVFSVRDSSGKVLIDIGFFLHEYSEIWKITNI